MSIVSSQGTNSSSKVGGELHQDNGADGKTIKSFLPLGPLVVVNDRRLMRAIQLHITKTIPSLM